MLKLTNVTKKFGELTAVNSLSFTVDKGQVFGIAGPNGAGKSTLYNLISGLYSFEGAISFKGKDIGGLPLGCRKIILVPYFKRRIWILGLLNFGV